MHRFRVPRPVPTPGYLVASLLLGAASHAFAGGDEPVLTVMQSTGNVAAYADAAETKSGASETESFSENLDAAFPVLPISSNVSANAALPSASGSGYGGASSNYVGGRLWVAADAGADANGDGFMFHGYGDGYASLGIDFIPARPVWAEIYLGGFTEMGGGNEARFSGGPFEFAAYDFDEVMQTVMLYPGVSCSLSCSAGASAMDVDGINASASSYAEVEVLVEYEGILFLGDNAFDTAGASGVFDMTGECDPGEFGADTIESPVYYVFSAPRDGFYTFSTCNQTTLDTRIAITDYGPTPDRVIACGDESPGCAGYTTELSLALSASINYTVVLGGTFTGTGDGTITVSLRGDLNNDGNIDGGDIGLLIGNWGGTGIGDLNGDGIVDSADLGIMLGLFTG